MDESLVRDLAFPVVVAVAPAEEELFLPLSRAYFADPDRALARRDAGGGQLAFDAPTVAAVAAVVVTPVVLAAMTEVVAYVVGKALDRTGPAADRAVRRLFGAEPGTSPPGAGEPAVLSPEQWSEVRRLVQEVARAAGVAEATASLIADAVVGRGRNGRAESESETESEAV